MAKISKALGEATPAAAPAPLEATETALRQAEQRFHAAFENAAVGMAYLDLEGHWRYVNQKFCDLMGYRPAELLARNFQDLSHPDDVLAERVMLGHLLEGEISNYSIDKRFRHREGDWVWVNLTRSLVRDETGAPEYLIAVAQDIQARKSAERALRESEARLRAVVETAVDGIITIDERGTVETVNPAAERIFGYSASEMIGRNVNMLMPEPYHGEHDRYVQNYLRTGQKKIIGIGREVVGRRKDGTLFPMDLAVSETHLGERRGFTGLVRDITVRKRNEEELRRLKDKLEERVRERTAQLQAANLGLARQVEERKRVERELRESVAELETFSYSLSHDMRAPLRAMKSFSQILELEHGPTLGEAGRDMLLKIGKAASRLDRLIQDVLSYSRLLRTQIALEPIDLEELIGQIIHERPNLHAAQMEIAHPLLPVLAHPAALTQCLSNLLDNAVKFTPADRQPKVRIWTEPVAGPPGGREDRGWRMEDSGGEGEDGGGRREDSGANLEHPTSNLEHRTEATDHERLATDQSLNSQPSTLNSYVRLWIEDNGIGIAAEMHERIFGMFERLHAAEQYSGTGIGLTIVRKAVQRMGGRVGLDSEVGRGTKFWLLLRGVPRADPGAAGAVS